jgi:hypothetical protein
MGLPARIGDHRGNGPAADGLFDGPQQIGCTFHPAEDDLARIDTEAVETDRIGNAQILAIADQLQEEQRGTLDADELPRQPQRETEGRAGIATGVGEDLVQNPGGKRKHLVFGCWRCEILQNRPFFNAFDAGPQIFQRPLFGQDLHQALPVPV